MSMIPKIDVVVENFAPGRHQDDGFRVRGMQEGQSEDHHVLDLEAGQTGPLSYKAGYDYIGQAYAGDHRRHRRNRSCRRRSLRWRSATCRPALRRRWRWALRCSIASAPAKASTSTPRLLDTYFHMHEAERADGLVARRQVSSDSQRLAASGWRSYRNFPLPGRPVRLPDRDAASVAADGACDGHAGAGDATRAFATPADGATTTSSCRRSSRNGSRAFPPAMRRSPRSTRNACLRARALAQRSDGASASATSARPCAG